MIEEAADLGEASHLMDWDWEERKKIKTLGILSNGREARREK
jgi:hypothetical protein